MKEEGHECFLFPLFVAELDLLINRNLVLRRSYVSKKWLNRRPNIGGARIGEDKIERQSHRSTKKAADTKTNDPRPLYRLRRQGFCRQRLPG
jgi:hypothetical protein